jgi:hypothetical protein
MIRRWKHGWRRGRSTSASSSTRPPTGMPFRSDETPGLRSCRWRIPCRDERRCPSPNWPPRLSSSPPAGAIQTPARSPMRPACRSEMCGSRCATGQVRSPWCGKARGSVSCRNRLCRKSDGGCESQASIRHCIVTLVSSHRPSDRSRGPAACLSRSLVA